LDLEVGQRHTRPLAEAAVPAKKKPAVDREAGESTAGQEPEKEWDPAG
jgi:hypothetical protein